MMDMNQVLLTGNLDGDVEVKTSGDTTYARFSLASNYRVRAKDGEGYEDRCNWTRVTPFGGFLAAPPAPLTFGADQHLHPGRRAHLGH